MTTMELNLRKQCFTELIQATRTAPLLNYSVIISRISFGTR